MKIKLLTFMAISSLVLFSCANIGTGTATGGLGGAVAGGALCSKLANGDHKILVSLGCSIIGAVAGAWAGSKWDEKDDKEAMNVLNTYADGDVASWKNPDTQAQFSLKPVATYKNNKGQYCRRFELVFNGNSQNKQACRSEVTGRWKFMDV